MQFPVARHIQTDLVLFTLTDTLYDLIMHILISANVSHFLTRHTMELVIGL